MRGPNWLPKYCCDIPSDEVIVRSMVHERAKATAPGLFLAVVAGQKHPKESIKKKKIDDGGH